MKNSGLTQQQLASSIELYPSMMYPKVAHILCKIFCAVFSSLYENANSFKTFGPLKKCTLNSDFVVSRQDQVV